MTLVRKGGCGTSDVNGTGVLGVATCSRADPPGDMGARTRMATRYGNSDDHHSCNTRIRITEATYAAPRSRMRPFGAEVSLE